MGIFDYPLKKVSSTEMNNIPLAVEWLDQHFQLTSWIDGKFINLPELCKLQLDNNCFSLEHGVGMNKCTKIYESSCCAENAVKSSRIAQSKWCLEPESYSDALYRLKERLSLSKQLFKELNVVCAKEFDYQLFVDYVNYYSSLPDFDWGDGRPVGVVLVVLSQKTPDWVMSMTVVSALLSGCSIILKPSRKASLSAFLFAEVCKEAGLPDGLINVMPGSKITAKELCAVGVNKVVFHGNHKLAKEMIYDNKIRNLTFLNTNHTAAIILEPCDLQGVVDKLFSETWNEDSHPTWSVDMVIVQESIFESFLEKMTDKILRFRDRMNNELKYKDKHMRNKILELVSRKKMMGIKVIESEGIGNQFWGPTLIVEHEMDREDWMMETSSDVEAPVMRVFIGRTARESVELANSFPYCLATSVWTESPSQAVDVASKLVSGTVWVNCHGIVDPSVPLESSRYSGFGSFGGTVGMKSYLNDDFSRVDKLYNDSRSDSYCEPIATNKLVETSMSAFVKWKQELNRRDFIRAVLKNLNNTDLKEFHDIVKYWAVNGNTYEMSLRGNTSSCFHVSQIKEAIGVVQIDIYNDVIDPVHALVSLVTPAIIFGNTVIVNIQKVGDPKMKKVIDCFVKSIPTGVVNVTKDFDGRFNLAYDPKVGAVWICGASSTALENLDLYATLRSFKQIWMTPERVPKCKVLLEEHCLKTKAIWFTKSTEG